MSIDEEFLKKMNEFSKDQGAVNRQCFLNCANIHQNGQRIMALETSMDQLNKTIEDLVARNAELERRLNELEPKA